MKFKDYYQVLGVDRKAPLPEIKKAYRRLVRQHHPDVNPAPEAQARMQEINEAWEVLQDADKRSAYDQAGQRWQGGADFQPPPDWGPGSGFAGDTGAAAADHSDFFEALFGAARRQQAGRAGGGSADFAVRGEDHHARIVVPLQDVFDGATRGVTLRGPVMDEHGQVQLRERVLQVRIPRGMRAGQQIRLAGQGMPGVGAGPAGDLYLELQFEPQSRYRVDGRDLVLTLPVAPWEAALGASVTVQTPGGEVTLSVPPHSQPGRRLRLRGRGIPAGSADGTPGDLYAELAVRLPPADTPQAQEAYRRMARDLAFDPRPTPGS